MQRTAVNPWNWSLNIGFDQAELIEGGRRQLVCSGQTSVDADGRPQHPGDMRAQVGLAMDNVEAVLAGADMRLGVPITPPQRAATATSHTQCPLHTTPALCEADTGCVK
ncbi:hypothetical protein K1T35_28040 [Pseudonocardia sp. DSM 110487]|uniref:RidA family protein n=1 Tax=Pseudonocardia sp. DSM 110487 TaxID=2865833 RepID=UPI001C6A48B5|nr:RidA family protein [Pseudonocardia sp. DSM 110487]QYN32436.1 hypothetical protein K1T35_28040 [Pseudonocardia sp. DSM 110487]